MDQGVGPTRRVVISLGVVACLFVGAPWAGAQEALADEATARMEELLQEARDLGNEGKYEKAVKVGEEVLKQSEKAYGREDSRTAETILLLGIGYQRDRQYQKAETLLKEAVGIFKRVYGPDDLHVVRGLRNLAFVYHRQGDISQSKELLQRADAIGELGGELDETWRRFKSGLVTQDEGAP